MSATTAAVSALPDSPTGVWEVRAEDGTSTYLDFDRRRCLRVPSPAQPYSNEWVTDGRWLPLTEVAEPVQVGAVAIYFRRNGFDQVTTATITELTHLDPASVPEGL
jgi:hypothetical protein